MNSQTETSDKVRTGWAVVTYFDNADGSTDEHVCAMWHEKADAEKACEAMENNFRSTGDLTAVVREVKITIEILPQ